MAAAPFVPGLIQQSDGAVHCLANALGSLRRLVKRAMVDVVIREQWPSRELERQLKGALFERTILSPPKVSAVLTQIHPAAETIFKDTYDLARSVSPALIAEYQTALPDKQLLWRKLHEFYQLARLLTPPAPRKRRTPPPDFGLWTLDLGLWTLDFGLWTLDLGPWTLDLGL